MNKIDRLCAKGVPAMAPVDSVDNQPPVAVEAAVASGETA